jgi:ADP-ribose pyrophosphatase YjhB (NUDIX family)
MSDHPILSRKQFFEKGHEYYLTHLSIDCVIFGYHEQELRVLLLEWKDTHRWCLPGGFILKDEHINDAAIRIARFRTGLEDLHLQQFYVFGDPTRGRGIHGMDAPAEAKGPGWMQERFVTIGYWTLVEFSKVVPTPDEFSIACQWWDIAKVPRLVLDHSAILEKALQSVRQHLNEFPIGRELLPTKFTMPELQRLYETILGKNLDRRNFQKKMLGLDILDRLAERKAGVAHKAPYLYRFNTRKYQLAVKSGWKLGLL